MEPGIISALIGFGGVIIGTGLSALVSLLTVKSNHKAEKTNTDRMLSSQYITDKRVQWIQDLRSEIAVFAANVRFVLGYSKVQKQDIYEAQIPEAITEVLRSARKIQMMLNPTDDKELIQLIEEVLVAVPGAINNSDSTMDTVKKDMDSILTMTQNTLKKEWERSKKEIRGGIA